MSFSGNVHSVMLTLENCEIVEIAAKDILWMYMGDVKPKALRYANGLSIHNVLGKFAIVLHKDTPSDFYGAMTLADRLSMRDVTHVTFFGANETMESYAVEWGDYNHNDQLSINQKVQFTPNGHIIFTSTTSDLIQVDAESIDSFSTYIR